MTSLYRAVLVLIGAVIIFNPLYTLLAIADGGNPTTTIIGPLKYTPYILLVLSLAGAFLYAVKERPASTFRQPLEIKLVLALFIYCLGAILLSSASLWQAMRGFNADFAGLILFAAIWLVRPGLRAARMLRNLVAGALAALLTLAIPEIFANRAYRLWSGHRLDNHYVVGHIPQLRSLTTGPNPLGTLMTLLAGVSAASLVRPRLLLATMLPIGIIMGLTHARSAWIGAAVMGGGYFFYRLIRRRQITLWPLLLGAAILFGASTSTIQYRETFWNVITHGSSTEEHGEAAQAAIEDTYSNTPLQILFGHGLGTAGPIVFDTDEAKKKDLPKIVESWYIQLFQEIGIVGLGLYIALLATVIRRLFMNGQTIIGFLALGLAVNALTLHIWSADPNLNLMFWTIAALALYSPVFKPQRPTADAR